MATAKQSTEYNITKNCACERALSATKVGSLNAVHTDDEQWHSMCVGDESGALPYVRRRQRRLRYAARSRRTQTAKKRRGVSDEAAGLKQQAGNGTQPMGTREHVHRHLYAVATASRCTLLNGKGETEVCLHVAHSVLDPYERQILRTAIPKDLRTAGGGAL